MPTIAYEDRLHIDTNVIKNKLSQSGIIRFATAYFFHYSIHWHQQERQYIQSDSQALIKYRQHPGKPDNGYIQTSIVAYPRTYSKNHALAGIQREMLVDCQLGGIRIALKKAPYRKAAQAISCGAN